MTQSPDPMLTAEADPEYQTRIDAARVTAQFAVPLSHEEQARRRRASYTRTDGALLFEDGPQQQDSFSFGLKTSEVL